ncbi:hypothetical protein VMCG_04292 [Cytospora schulzeri]|uniref:G domain-containing protein n=1 Tax=Cytospora schulzeri TaxID=448051 RepID=A0A423WT53_9PEZI|nr:hypothetical protein VMCG_04292 [Valsa malicola]
MAGSPVKFEPPHIKPDPGADADDTGIDASITTAEDVKDGATQATAARETNYIERLVSNASTEELEAGVKIGVQLLDNLKPPLQAALVSGDTQASNWLESITRLQDEAKPARTVVGVVGNTGAGKSSVINALLDEERLVPTNGMRACTASATEISYNYSDDPEQLYRAEIEFISAADWAQELTTLLDDLLDGNGQVSRECTTPDTEANLAYSKIKAVYPHLTKEMIATSSPADLAQAPSIRSVIGSLKRLSATTSSQLFQGLQHYVDSKEKTSGNGHVMEYWPLIKVVRIYCKADALSTGAVIVDLPGIQDSNAARAAVAESYMKACTGLWITAAIQRAVDDKTAKNLLGDSFKRQLKYDGTYSAVTFICTKTDDILESEVAASLHIEGEMGESWARIEEFRNEQRELKRKVGDLKDRKNAIDDEMEDLDTKFDLWEDLATKLRDGETVYRPSDNASKKRKRDSSPGRHRKRRGSIDITSDSDGSYDSDGSDKENSQSVQETRTPLTEDEIEMELVQIKSRKKDYRKSRKALDENISATKKELNSIVSQERALLSQVKSICIKGRNDYSRSAIKNDFAMGIKELDQQTAIEEDETAFDPDEDVRDYDEVARSLPVFTVSGRAYQKLSGRLRKDAVHELYTAVEDCSSSFKDALGEQLYETFDRLIPAASDSAVATATGWGAHRSLGGLFWATYKATTRRSGVFAGASGQKDFNAELFEPISKHLAGNWERAFQRRLPAALDSFARTCKHIIKAFHDDALAGVQQDLTQNPAGLNMLNQQIRVYTATMEDAPTALRTAITERQRDASREFTPVIQQAMQHAYDVCTAERGTGSYARMKVSMQSHVETARHTMFSQACDTVKNDLEEMCTYVGKAMLILVDNMFVKLEKDYLAVLIGDDAEIEGGAVPWAELMLRGEMKKRLEKADSWFAGLFPSKENDDAPDELDDAEEDLIARQLEGSHEVQSPRVKPEF